MKKTSIAVVSLVGLFGMSYRVAAAENHAIDSNAVIEFTKSLEEEDVDVPGIIDPETIDPENPENPSPNPNPENNLLRINYVSNFDFGIWGNTANKIVAYAKAQRIHLTDGSITEVAPFVSTIDNRGTERGEGWQLEVSATALTDANDNILKGAEIILANGFYDNSANAPQVSTGELNISQGTQVLATTKSLTGSGQWSMALGNLKSFTTQLPTQESPEETEEVTYTVTDGVRMEIPRNTVTNNSEYSGLIHWNLVSSI